MNWTVPDSSRSTVSNATHHCAVHTSNASKRIHGKPLILRLIKLHKLCRENFFSKTTFLFSYHSICFPSPQANELLFPFLPRQRQNGIMAGLTATVPNND